MVFALGAGVSLYEGILHILFPKPISDCNGQLKQDTFLSRFLVKFPLKFQRGLVA
jgi:hypothetical protein